LPGDKMDGTLRVPAAQPSREGEGDAGFIVVQSGEGDAMPEGKWRGAPTPKGQRTGTEFTGTIFEGVNVELSEYGFHRHGKLNGGIELNYANRCHCNVTERRCCSRCPTSCDCQPTGSLGRAFSATGELE
jgi:hypothetical protein